jgi:uncharacterized spore protein YtfJ
MEHVNQMMGMISDQLLAAGESDVAVGEPFQIGAYKVIVVTRTSVGFGGGGGEGEGVGPHPHQRKGPGPGRSPAPGVKGKGTGGGAGGGLKVRPVGVIAFGPEGVQVLPVPDKPGILDKLFEKVPELVEKIQAMFPEKAGN